MNPVILINSSKTMRNDTPEAVKNYPMTEPVFAPVAHSIARQLKRLSEDELRRRMKLSSHLSQQTYKLVQSYNPNAAKMAALFAFSGDIYKSLQADRFSRSEVLYANNHLRILSGLYGVLRPLDKIQSYRLEMGYSLPINDHSSMYDEWGSSLADTIPRKATIINLLSQEYAKAIIPYLENRQSVVITPLFKSIDTNGRQKNIAIHTKYARGCFARWMIRHRIESLDAIRSFEMCDYRYTKNGCQPNAPLYLKEIE